MNSTDDVTVKTTVAVVGAVVGAAGTIISAGIAIPADIVDGLATGVDAATIT